jgi:hypothetical protein
MVDACGVADTRAIVPAYPVEARANTATSGSHAFACANGTQPAIDAKLDKLKALRAESRAKFSGGRIGISSEVRDAWCRDHMREAQT